MANKNYMSEKADWPRGDEIPTTKWLDEQGLTYCLNLLGHWNEGVFFEEYSPNDNPVLYGFGNIKGVHIDKNKKETVRQNRKNDDIRNFHNS